MVENYPNGSEKHSSHEIFFMSTPSWKELRVEERQHERWDITARLVLWVVVVALVLGSAWLGWIILDFVSPPVTYTASQAYEQGVHDGWWRGTLGETMYDTLPQADGAQMGLGSAFYQGINK